jgi:hypothetical protein
MIQWYMESDPIHCPCSAAHKGTSWVYAGTDDVNGFRLFFASITSDGFHANFGMGEVVKNKISN